MVEAFKTKKLTRSATPRLRRELSRTPTGEGRGKKQRSGSTLSLRPEPRPRGKPQPSGRGVERLTIAIDGPSGAGKSTVARSLAKRLDYIYIDTGAMYRSVALRVKEKNISPEDELALNQLASSLHITFFTKGEQTRVFCEGKDITEAIRTPEISRLASSISRKKGVREALVQMQREMGKEGGVVLEGRDIGTIVFPDADVKFYLDAESNERVRRRYHEMVEKGVTVDYKETQEELVQRDHHDMHRIHSPLKKADDALLIDSTHRSVEEVVEEMVRIIKGKIMSYE
jgi:CMP/dCMP kinase